MTGLEQLVVWMLGIVCSTIAACSVAKSWAQGLVEAAGKHADVHVEAHRVVAGGQFSRVIVPPEWTASSSEEGQ